MKIVSRRLARDGDATLTEGYVLFSYRQLRKLKDDGQKHQPKKEREAKS